MKFCPYYVLDEHDNPQPCEDVLIWARWMHEHERHVAHDMDEGEGARAIRVSTVFLGLDHNHAMTGPPILFESMVFGGALDQTQRRYATRAEALRGHEELCAQVRASEASR